MLGLTSSDSLGDCFLCSADGGNNLILLGPKFIAMILGKERLKLWVKLRPRKVKVVRSFTSNVVGWSRQVVKPRNTTMVLLVDAKEPQ